jgi:hypothetical protein
MGDGKSVTKSPVCGSRLAVCGVRKKIRSGKLKTATPPYLLESRRQNFTYFNLTRHLADIALFYFQV